MNKHIETLLQLLPEKYSVGDAQYSGKFHTFTLLSKDDPNRYHVTIKFSDWGITMIDILCISESKHGQMNIGIRHGDLCDNEFAVSKFIKVVDMLRDNADDLILAGGKP